MSSGSVMIFHNVVWSRHKGVVFSALHNISTASGIKYSIVQISETEHFRCASCSMAATRMYRPGA
jgi:hypothetical protein